MALYFYEFGWDCINVNGLVWKKKNCKIQGKMLPAERLCMLYDRKTALMIGFFKQHHNNDNMSGQAHFIEVNVRSQIYMKNYYQIMIAEGNQ